MKICDMDYCSQEVEDDDQLCLRCEKQMFDAQAEHMEMIQ
jgi:hypothetical protein